MALTGDRFGVDSSKCIFFKQGYLEKLADALKGYTCSIRLPEVSAGDSKDEIQDV